MAASHRSERYPNGAFCSEGSYRARPALDPQGGTARVECLAFGRSGTTRISPATQPVPRALDESPEHDERRSHKATIERSLMRSPEAAADGGAMSFEVAVSFLGTYPLLAVRGELDSSTAPVLGGFLETMISGGHRLVVLDLAHTSFVDAAALSVIAHAARRAVDANGKLVLRGPSPAVRRLLDIAGLDRILHIEPSLATPHLGAAQEEVGPNTSALIGGSDLGHRLQRVSAAAADADVVDAALRLVVALARETVGGADGVSISLRRHGRLSTVAASDQTILDMDADQYATGEGPCVAASEEGRWFHVERLETETRWPEFVPRARALGINAILSSPLLAKDRPVGALNIYSHTATAFAPKDQELAAVFAGEASVIVNAAAVDLDEEELADRFRAALRTRELIATAKGILMERSVIDEAGAYAELIRRSRTTSKPIAELASALVEGIAPAVVEFSPEEAPDDPHG